MGVMFRNAVNFDQDLTNWNVSNVTSMDGMFSGAVNFYGDISSWNVSSVTSMGDMFSAHIHFNQDLSTWDVSNVTNMFAMFEDAENFNQDLSSWDISSVEEMNDMFNGTQSLSDYNKCAIHTSFSSNANWPYDWSESCNLSNETSLIAPQNFSLHQNYPNPFNPTTTLKYELPEDSFVDVTVYDMLGNVVNNLVNANQSSGYKSIQWDATKNNGEPVSAGVYLYRIQASDFVVTKKMILLK